VLDGAPAAFPSSSSTAAAIDPATTRRRSASERWPAGRDAFVVVVAERHGHEPIPGGDGARPESGTFEVTHEIGARGQPYRDFSGPKVVVSRHIGERSEVWQPNAG
jgi:hypothetical protein